MKWGVNSRPMGSHMSRNQLCDECDKKDGKGQEGSSCSKVMPWLQWALLLLMGHFRCTGCEETRGKKRVCWIVGCV